ncbi:MAG: hypothetical protein P1P87_08095 [Trueperaceae bacterium]|nr:hypothetical protein [Trueperaceae bacterium]
MKPIPDGLLGRTGAFSGQQALVHLKALVPDGTVALAQVDDDGVPSVRGVALLALVGGEVKARHLLGRFAGLAVTDLAVHAVAHAPSGVPTLPSLAPEAPIDALRALPRLVPGRPLPADAVPLAALLTRLETRGWHGALVVRAGAGVALALLVAGHVAAANAHRPRSAGGTIADGFDALRALARFAGEEGATVELVPLDPTSAAAIAGYAARRTRPAGETPASGLTVNAEGVALHVRGEALLRVTAEPQRRGPFALIDVPGSQLRLPEDAPDWVARRYAITLRGRDALNPMTDHWMRFRTTYGARGQRLLEAFGEGASVEELAITHGVELDELAGWVKKWGDEGLVRGG